MRGCFTRSKRSHLVHFTQNSSNKQTQSTHRKARLEPAIRDAQKLGQNIFTPWNSLLGYGFEPRLNSLAHVTAGPVMITGLSIKEMPALGKEVCKYKTRWTWRLKFGVGKPQRLDVIQTKLPFLLPTQEDKGRLGSQQKIKKTDNQKTKKQIKHGRGNCDGYTAEHKIFPINVYWWS